jgi:mRNA-degrading endonuclease YafQ of YafQ-DinJ toxin-antitoxin module|tara:strand:- start:1434 stop:1616 length:183 start_codon:yes stop_codon:yes gene_type:complete
MEMNKLEQTISFLSNMEKVFYKDFLSSQQKKRDEVDQLRNVISLLEMERETFQEGDYENE